MTDWPNDQTNNHVKLVPSQPSLARLSLAWLGLSWAILPTPQPHIECTTFRVWGFVFLATELYSTVLYCIVLYWIVLYCIVLNLFCTVLYCTVLYCIILHCILLYCTEQDPDICQKEWNYLHLSFSTWHDMTWLVIKQIYMVALLPRC